MRDWKVLFFDKEGPSILELARQALSSTETGYDLLSEKFDYTPYRTPQVMLDRVSHHLGEMGTFGSALDVCCGTGAMTGVVLDHTSGKVTGLDISRGMIDVAKRKLCFHQAFERVEFVRGEALSLPFEDEFDLVTNFGGLGHIVHRDVPLFIDQVYKVLHSGGKFIIVSTEYPSVLTLAFWRGHAFNVLMYIRNILLKPPFIMYYLTFSLPKIKNQLEEKGFEVEVKEGVFPKPFHNFKLITATKK